MLNKWTDWHQPICAHSKWHLMRKVSVVSRGGYSSILNWVITDTMARSVIVEDFYPTPTPQKKETVAKIE